MTAAAHQVLAEIDALPMVEREAVITELLLRHPAGGDLPATAFEELADEIFQSYDAAEATDASSPR